MQTLCWAKMTDTQKAHTDWYDATCTIFQHRQNYLYVWKVDQPLPGPRGVTIKGQRGILRLTEMFQNFQRCIHLSKHTLKMGIFKQKLFKNFKSRYVIWKFKHKKEKIKLENNQVTYEIKHSIITQTTFISVYQKIKSYRQIYILASKLPKHYHAY